MTSSLHQGSSPTARYDFEFESLSEAFQTIIPSLFNMSLLFIIKRQNRRINELDRKLKNENN
jgi:hypothetical protein